MLKDTCPHFKQLLWFDNLFRIVRPYVVLLKNLTSILVLFYDVLSCIFIFLHLHMYQCDIHFQILYLKYSSVMCKVLNVLTYSNNTCHNLGNWVTAHKWFKFTSDVSIRSIYFNVSQIPCEFIS